MTEEQLKKIPFHFVGHMSFETENIAYYQSNDEKGRLGFCEITKKKDEFNFGRTRREYRIDNKWYKSKKKFLEALKDFEL